MISVVIAADDDAEGLCAALADLVTAAVDGLVREVLVTGAQGRSREIADDAGAVLVDADLSAAAARAKSDWLMILPPRSCLADGWAAAVAAHVSARPPRAARLATGGPGWPWDRLRGVLAPKAQLSKAQHAGSAMQQAIKAAGARMTLKVCR
jgi:hypothetical protein